MTSCKTGTDTSTPLAVSVRIPIEPETLNPLFAKSSYATQISSLILLPVADYDPVSLKLSPLLITEMPVAEKVTEGKHIGGQRYQLHFRPEATWSDGKPVTTEDYLFTLKAIFNPYVSAPTTRGLLNFISEVETDPNDPLHLSAYVDSSYILALEVVTNFNLYPAHLYDPQNFMGKITLNELRDPNKKWSAEQDT
ncbi:MAG: ABC transporter substrate-binding protein, partial [Saprospiraceae bacterium]